MSRSQRHKIEEQGYTSRGEIYEQGAINDQILKRLGGAIVANLRPVLTSINPATAVCSSADLTMHALGSGFTTDTKIMFGGTQQVTTFVSATDITCVVKPSQAPLPKLVTVQVITGASLPSSATKSFSFTATGMEDPQAVRGTLTDERERGPFPLLRIEPDEDGGAWYVFERMDIEEGDTLRAEATGNSGTNGDFEVVDISDEVAGETAVYWKDAEIAEEIVGKGRLTII
jgi:hypothetical protein